MSPRERRPPLVQLSVNAAPGSRQAEAQVTRVLEGLRRVLRVLRVSSRQAEQRLGVSGAQLLVLQQLERAPARSLNELAERTHTDQSSVSVVVSRLVARGLVTREISVADGRRVTLAATAAGRALTRRSPDASQAQLVAALESLPRRILVAVARGLVALEVALEDGPTGRERGGAQGGAELARRGTARRGYGAG